MAENSMERRLVRAAEAEEAEREARAEHQAFVGRLLGGLDPYKGDESGEDEDGEAA